MTYRLFWLSLLSLFAGLMALSAQNLRPPSDPGSIYIEVHDAGQINWTENVITATGVGLMPRSEPDRAKAYLKARGYARLDALANLLTVIDRIQIDAQYTGEDYMAQSEIIRAAVNGFLRGTAVMEEKKIFIEGQEAVQVTVGTAMYGNRGLSSALLRPALTNPAAAPAPQPALPRIVLSQPNTSALETSLSLEGNYTGLIIDARGLKVSPTMAPKILKADGSTLYGTGSLDIDDLMEKGMVAYFKDLEAAKGHARAGNKPLVIRAIGVYKREAASSDVVISDADAAKLTAEDSRTGFLKKMNVIFVVD